MQREWCPSQATANPDAGRHADSNAGCAWQRSVAAAHSDISAFRQADKVPRKVLSVPRFSPSVVASKTNKNYIPLEPAAEVNFRVGAASFKNANVTMSSGFLGAADEEEPKPTMVAAPANQADALLTHFAKHPVSGQLTLRDVVFLPSLAGTVAVEDVLTAVGYSHSLVQNLTTLSLSGGTTVSSRPPRLTRFIQDAKALQCLGLPRCHLSPYISELCAAVAETTMEHVSLAGNDAGVDQEHAEENTTALAELLKRSKFLLSLDLSANGFSATAVHDMMMALASSDTKLLPADLPPQPEPDVIAADELVSGQHIMGSSDADEEEEGKDDETQLDEDEQDDEYDDGIGFHNDESDGDGDDDADEERDDVDDGEREAADDEEAAASMSNSEDDEEKEERARAAYEARVARIASQTAREETRMRRTVLRQYLRETKAAMAPLYYDIVALRANEEDARVATFCERRSGWSHLQWLSLAGNSVGDRGAAGLATALLDEVKLDEEQVRDAEDGLRDGVQKLVETLISARQETLQLEAKERSSLVERLQVTLETAEKRSMYGEVDEDDYAAPDVIMTNIDDTQPDGADGGEYNDAGDDHAGASGMIAIDEEGIESDMTQWTLPVSSTKRGMNSLRYLDLSGCAIGNRGLKHLAKSLLANRSVEVLVLRDNRFGKSAKQEALEGTRDDSGTAPSGIVALAQALCSNEVLQSLDLSYCRLDGASLRLLSEALRDNQTLRTLRLEGNSNMGQDNSISAADDDATSCLLELLQAIRESGVQHLSLSHNNLEGSLWQEEIEALCETSLKLKSLELSDAGLTGTHVAKWLDALQDRTCPLQRLHLARNTFTDAADGLVVRALLTRCPQLHELCLDDNTALRSSGMAAMLGGAGHDLPPIRRLACCRTGLTAPALDADTPVLAFSLLASLEHLDLGDVTVENTDVFQNWVDLCKTHCRHLQYLSFWSREVSMEGHMASARELVEAIPSLLYTDFGVLLRFDSPRDLEDDLGCVERELVKRRAHSTL